MNRLQWAAKCALADLAGIMPEFDPSGERSHPGWKTMVDLYDGLVEQNVDVAEWAGQIEGIRKDAK